MTTDRVTSANVGAPSEAAAGKGQAWQRGQALLAAMEADEQRFSDLANPTTAFLRLVHRTPADLLALGLDERQVVLDCWVIETMATLNRGRYVRYDVLLDGEGGQEGTVRLRALTTLGAAVELLALAFGTADPRIDPQSFVRCGNALISGIRAGLSTAALEMDEAVIRWLPAAQDGVARLRACMELEAATGRGVRNEQAAPSEASDVPVGPLSIGEIARLLGRRPEKNYGGRRDYRQVKKLLGPALERKEHTKLYYVHLGRLDPRLRGKFAVPAWGGDGGALDG